MSLTAAQARAKLYADRDFGWNILGFASVAHRTQTSIIDPLWFATLSNGEHQFKDGWIHHPTMTDGEGRIKRAGNLSISTANALDHGDTVNWDAANPLAEPYEWNPPHVHPDQLTECLRQALRQAWVYNNLPETPWDDGNFEAPDTDSWATVNVGSMDKLGDQLYGLVGSNSMVVQNNGGAGYAYHALGLNVQPNQSYQLNALAKCIRGGPIRWRIFDMTTGWVGDGINAELGDVHGAVAYGFTPVQLRQTVTIPNNVYLITCMLQNIDAAGITAWDALPGRNLGSKRFDLQSWNKNGFNIRGVSERRYGSMLQQGPPPAGFLGAGQFAWDATSPEDHAWERKRDFITENFGINSSPSAVKLTRPSRIPDDVELWYPSQRTWADADTGLEDEVSASNCHEDLLMALFKVNACELLAKEDGPARWAEPKAKAQAIANSWRDAGKQEAPPKRHQVINTGVGAGRGRMR